MNQLVRIENNHVFTTTLIIAEGVNLEHRAVMKLLDTHINRPSFSALEMLKKRASGSGKPTRYAELSEQQSAFLITLMRNSDIVVNFKESLSIEFVRMRESIQKIATQQTNEQWINQRDSGIIPRRLETDVIKLFIEYAINQGGSIKGCKRYYQNLSKMENKALFIIEQKYKNLRNILGITELQSIQQADYIVSKALQDGMNDKLHYKDIFKLAKSRVEMFAEIRGKSPLAHLAIESNK